VAGAWRPTAGGAVDGRRQPAAAAGQICHQSYHQ